MNAPGRLPFPADILGFFGRHLVAICVTYREVGDDAAEREPRFAAYNGTLIRIKDAICFLTAGHVLAELEARFKDDRIGILETVIVDTFGTDRISDHPIPFDLR